MKRHFRDAIACISEIRLFIGFAFVLFCAGVAVGLFFPEQYHSLLEPLKRIAREIDMTNTPGIILIILRKNFLAVLFSIWFGAALGIFPAGAAFLNGIVMGLVFSLGSTLGLWGIVLRIVPHGIFEFPAMFIAFGLGLWLGAWPFRRNKEETFRSRFFMANRVLLAVVFPLLLAAAVVEGLAIALFTL